MSSEPAINRDGYLMVSLYVCARVLFSYELLYFLWKRVEGFLEGIPYKCNRTLDNIASITYIVVY